MTKSKNDPGLLREVIKDRRLDLGYTQTDLSELVGYTHRNFIAMIELGKSRVPLDKWLAFADALHIPRHVFIELALSEFKPDIMPYLQFSSPK